MKINNIITFYSEEDKCWFAIPEKYPSISGFGDTEQDAIEELKIVLNEIEQWEKEDTENIQKQSIISS